MVAKEKGKLRRIFKENKIKIAGQRVNGISLTKLLDRSKAHPNFPEEKFLNTKELLGLPVTDEVNPNIYGKVRYGPVLASGDVEIEVYLFEKGTIGKKVLRKIDRSIAEYLTTKEDLDKTEEVIEEVPKTFYAHIRRVI